MNDVHVFATGDRGRRLVQVIFRKPGRKFCTIERRNSKGELTGLEAGKRTLAATKDLSIAILSSQRYRNPEFVRTRNAAEENGFDSANREFLDRPETTRRIGLIDAATIPKWRRKKWPLPIGLRVACKSLNTGIVYEARKDERLHCQIALRLGTAHGSERLIDGFTVPKQKSLQRDAGDTKLEITER